MADDSPIPELVPIPPEAAAALAAWVEWLRQRRASESKGLLHAEPKTGAAGQTAPVPPPAAAGWLIASTPSIQEKRKCCQRNQRERSS